MIALRVLVVCVVLLGCRADWLGWWMPFTGNGLHAAEADDTIPGSVVVQPKAAALHLAKQSA